MQNKRVYEYKVKVVGTRHLSERWDVGFFEKEVGATFWYDAMAAPKRFEI